jgi:hypothetical protein
MHNGYNPAVLAVREAVAAAFSDTWLFQHGVAPRQTAESSCRYARDLLCRVHIDDLSVRSRLDTILSRCEAALKANSDEPSE